MSEKPYTDADVEIAVKAMWRVGAPCDGSFTRAEVARVVLDALTANGWRRVDQSAVVVDRDDLRVVLDQRVQHSHERPGRWDADGRACVECAARTQLTAALGDTDRTEPSR
ncbi:hypothetical protein QQG74_09795 [Micromonospora sp. FIMYZ51]|uniref:hypothetical protein n=1 Tax=Micromonospora sp. FIMYZ51 TaxID=3051832 RepID=UPI00311FB9E4